MIVFRANGSYVSQGKLGAAILGSVTAKDVSMCLCDVFVYIEFSDSALGTYFVEKMTLPNIFNSIHYVSLLVENGATIYGKSTKRARKSLKMIENKYILRCVKDIYMNNTRAVLSREDI